MNLAMVGKASLDEMQKWAEEKFSGVENKGVTIPDYSQPIMPFNEANLG
jgi:secreted Zn-dependent insulinase-like peptidase